MAGQPDAAGKWSLVGFYDVTSIVSLEREREREREGQQMPYAKKVDLCD